MCSFGVVIHAQGLASVDDRNPALPIIRSIPILPIVLGS